MHLAPGSGERRPVAPLEEASLLPVSDVKLTREDIETILREWQKRLKLSHWIITINWDEPTDEDNEAEYAAEDWYNQCSIKISKEWEQWERRHANVVLAHELVHLHLHEMHVAVNALEPKFKKDVWEMWFGRFHAGQERAVETLAQTFVDTLGTV